MTGQISSDAEAAFQGALLHHRQSRLAEARNLYEQALQLQPSHVNAMVMLAIIALDTGQAELAMQTVAKAVGSDPRSAVAHMISGHAQCRLRKYEEAISSYDEAIAIDPHVAQVYFHRGSALIELRNHAAAAASFETAVALNPASAEAHFGLGLSHARLARFEEAIASYDKAIALRPNFHEAHLNRGNALKDLLQYDGALAAYARAIEIGRSDPIAYCNRGNVLRLQGKLESALESFDAAVNVDSGCADAYVNRGSVLLELRRIDEALQDYDRAVAIRPADARAHFYRSSVLLMKGDFENGWREFEWRWRMQDDWMAAMRRTFAQPYWLGVEPVAGKTVLLFGEQGLGDTLQFCRYAAMVASLGARVIVQAQAPLARLLHSLEGVSEILAPSHAAPTADFVCSMMSLPHVFKTSLSSIPVKVPYLDCQEETALHWRRKLGEKTKLRVGLAWSGGFRADFPELWAVNTRRNIPLANFALLKHPDVEFFSLQKGADAEAELAELEKKAWEGPRITDFTREFTDFADTAGMIRNLDLVVSVDTSVAHLAGAMGMPVWILNRFDACWRWLLDRENSPYYPTARLYRQSSAGDWLTVLERVRADLVLLVQRQA